MVLEGVENATASLSRWLLAISVSILWVGATVGAGLGLALMTAFAAEMFRHHADAAKVFVGASALGLACIAGLSIPMSVAIVSPKRWRGAAIGGAVLVAIVVALAIVDAVALSTLDLH